MGSDQEAAAAIAGLSGKEHDGRALTVNEARPARSVAGVAVAVAGADAAVTAAAAAVEGRGRGYGGGGGGRGGRY